MVPPSGILDIIILIFYTPALAIAVYVGFKHGFGRSLGWYNLIMLGLFRVLGSALGIASIYEDNTSIIAAAITLSSMGTVSLVGALLGLSGRVNESLKEHGLPQIIRRLLGVITILAIVLASVGGSKVYSDDAGTRSTGHSLTQAAVCLMAVMYAIALGMCFQNVVNRGMIPRGEMRLLSVAIASLPFILVRLISALLGVFDYSNSTFSVISTSTTAIVVRAIMGTLMEFIVVAMFLWAGCAVDRSAAREAERSERHAAHGMFKGRDGNMHQAEGYNSYSAENKV